MIDSKLAAWPFMRRRDAHGAERTSRIGNLMRVCCIALAAGLWALAAASAPVAAAETDYSGSYAMEGRNPDGTAYTGTVDIVQSGTLAVLTWYIGNRIFIGTGIASNRSIAAAYGPVIVLFERGEDGGLTGVWTAQGQTQLGYEILRPIQP